jgi:hypothetical protein
MPPDEESRKFDIHACFAGMNIKFRFFLVGNKAVIQIRQSGSPYPKMWPSLGND